MLAMLQKHQITNKFQWSKLQTKEKAFWSFEIEIWDLFGLPARSPASRSLAEGRRFDEGRNLGFVIWNFNVCLVPAGPG
jgi:hypothetical protein